MKHINVALFVPDEGCPHRCSFCNQKTISGVSKKLSDEDIEKAVSVALKSSDDCNKGEIAFFGGSFTAIERYYMVSLLKKAKSYLDRGLFAGIRISTRPDCINEEILEILKYYGVTSIELGCQSMSDKVLQMNQRGHSAADVVNSAALIKKHSFQFGVQMMTGLYGDDDETCLETAKKLIELKPDTARIYPTIVLEGTELNRLYQCKIYEPETLEHAVELCSKLLMLFHENQIKVIRLGLHSGGNVEDGYVAGAYHPAFRELCESKIYLDKLTKILPEKNMPKGNITVTVGSKYVSQLTGQHKTNIEFLKNLGYNCSIEQNSDYNKYELDVRGIL